jgi:hypothetical protein
MNQQSLSRKWVVLLVVLAFISGGLIAGSVNALPFFSDHTGPSEMRITSFERIDAGCADTVATYTSSSTFSQTTFIATGDADANLSAWVERTSPRGADLSTFRVHVSSQSWGTTTDSFTAHKTGNDSCTVGVQYRITVTASGGSPQGLLPDAHGVRIQWVENGHLAGCSASVTSPLSAGCSPDSRYPDRVWENTSRMIIPDVHPLAVS